MFHRLFSLHPVQRRRLAAVVLGCAALSSLPAWAVKYTVTDIGALGINAALQLTDQGRILHRVGYDKPRIYFNGETTMTDASAYQDVVINDQGQYIYIDGLHFNPKFNDRGVLKILSSEFGDAPGLNQSGQGIYFTYVPGEYTSSAYFFNGDSIEKIPVTAPAAYAIPYAINNNGQVLGVFQSEKYRTQSTSKWSLQSGAFIYENGKVRDLDIGLDAQVYAMNDLGHIAGGASFDNRPDPRGQGKALTAFVYIDGVISNIVPRSSKMDTSRATTVNNAGQVMGVWRGPGANSGSDEGAFLYQNGKAIDLNDLPELQAGGWKVYTGYTDLQNWTASPLLNNKGQIVVQVAFPAPESYRHTTVLLDPIPEIDVKTSKNPAAFGEALTFTATTPASTGTVTFYEGEQLLATVTLNGKDASTSFTTAALAPGSHTITARYSGVSESSASLVQLVDSAAVCR